MHISISVHARRGLGGAAKAGLNGPGIREEKAMRLVALALTLSLAPSTVASAQIAMPDSENGRYSFNPVADGVLRLDLAPARSRTAPGAILAGSAR